MSESPLQRRLDDVEIKLTYAEDLIDELNRTIFRQQQQIDFLAGELRALRDQVHSMPQEKRSLRDDIPPHY
jgi:SlyX protein